MTTMLFTIFHSIAVAVMPLLSIIIMMNLHKALPSNSAALSPKTFGASVITILVALISALTAPYGDMPSWAASILQAWCAVFIALSILNLMIIASAAKHFSSMFDHFERQFQQ